MEDDQPLSEKVCNLLQQIPLFSGLSEDSYAVLSKRFVKTKYPQNAVIFNEGDEPTAMYIILSGKVEEYFIDDDGMDIINDVKKSEQFFGELAISGDPSQKYSVRTIMNTEFAMLTKLDFEGLLLSHATIASQLVSGLLRRLSNQPNRIESIYALDIYGRIAIALLDLAEKMGGKREFDTKLVMREVTGALGVATGMIWQLLYELEIYGLLTIEGKKVIINEELT